MFGLPGYRTLRQLSGSSETRERSRVSSKVLCDDLLPITWGRREFSCRRVSSASGEESQAEAKRAREAIRIREGSGECSRRTFSLLLIQGERLAWSLLLLFDASQAANDMRRMATFRRCESTKRHSHCRFALRRRPLSQEVLEATGEHFRGESQVTVWKWVQKYSKLVSEYFKTLNPTIGGKWRHDEMLFEAVYSDSAGPHVDSSALLP